MASAKLRWFACRLVVETDPSDGVVRPVGWRMADSDDPDVVIRGDGIGSLLTRIRTTRSCQIVFQNLDIDGRVLINEMMDRGMEPEDGDRPSTDNGFTSMITDDGRIIRIRLHSRSGDTGLLDMMHIVPVSLEEMRPMVLDGQRDWRISDDVCVMARMLAIILSQGLRRVTLSSNSYNDFLDMIGRQQARRWFPHLTKAENDLCSEAFHGGIVWLEPDWRDRPTGPGISVDANSLYPSVAISEPLPVGHPRHFDGKPPKDGLWIARLVADWEPKAGAVPCMPTRLCDRGQLEPPSEPKEITITSVDWENMTRWFDVDALEWQGGLWFHQRRGIFDPFVEKWGSIKHESEGGRRLMAKLMLNSLIGKFGSHTERRNRVVSRDDDGHPVIGEGEWTRTHGVYTPVASFVTAYGRRRLCEAMEANRERLVYADTDGMHLTGTEPPDGIRMDQRDFGAWKVEQVFDDSRHIREKAYVFRAGGHDIVKCSGMPENIRRALDWDTFRPGWSNVAEDGTIKPGLERIIPVFHGGGIRFVATRYRLAG